MYLAVDTLITGEVIVGALSRQRAGLVCLVVGEVLAELILLAGYKALVGTVSIATAKVGADAPTCVEGV